MAAAGIGRPIRRLGRPRRGQRSPARFLEGLEHDAHIQTIDKIEAVVQLAEGPLELDFRELSPGQIEGVLARRDRIVAYSDARIAEISVEAPVLYDLSPRSGLEPPGR